MNEFYTATGNPATGSTATSATMRAEFNAIVSAFDKLPTMTGNGNKILLVNPSGTGLTTSAAIAEVAGNVTITGTTALDVSSTTGGAAIVNVSATQTLTNKTLTNPTISQITNGGVLTLPTGPQTLVGRTTTDTLTNKTLTNPVINGFTGDTSVINVGSGQFYKDASGNFGFGTASPAYRIHAIGTGNIQIGVEGTTDASFITRIGGTQALYLHSTSGASEINELRALPLLFSVNGSVRMRIDANGYVGLGATPSAWVSSGNALEFGPSATGFLFNDSNNVNLGANAYYSTGWKYQTSSVGASRYAQSSGAHSWFVAPSGTAGAAITFVQAMTLDANGNLGVGMTPDALLSVNGPGRFGPSTVGTALSGTFYTSSLTDTFTVDTNKVLHNYGISAKTFSDVSGAPSLAIAGYAGIRFYTAQLERVRIDTAGNINAFAAINESQGATVASASTINLTTATGNLVHVSGTTTITGITLAQGYRRIVVFDGALTLTNGASLILPGAANITTAAGDSAVFVGEGAGVVRCVAYVRANGYPLLSGFGSSLAGSGYQKLPSGMILQWGSSITSSGSVTVTFPIAFPTAVSSVTSSAVRTVSTNNSVGPNTPGLSNCTFYDQAGAATTFFWMAVGN